MTHHFIPFQTPKSFRNAGSRECFRFARSLRWPGRADHQAFTASPVGMTVQLHGFSCCATRCGLRQMAFSSGTSINSAAGTGASEPPSPSNRDKSSGSTGGAASAADRMKGQLAARFFFSFVFMAPEFFAPVQEILTSTCRGLAFSFFTKCTVSTPSLNSALTFAGLASSGSEKLRPKVP
jgi:hypothetical protein